MKPAPEAAAAEGAHPLEQVAAEGPWGGPVSQYRGAEIQARRAAAGAGLMRPPDRPRRDRYPYMPERRRTVPDPRPDPIVLKHVTSLACAIAIVRTGLFRPAYASPLAGDSGLNAFEVGRRYVRDQKLQCEVASLFLEWTGPVGTLNDFPLPKNTLVRQGGHRSIVPHGTDRHLRAIRIEAEPEGWRDLHRPAPRWLVMPALKARWLEQKGLAEKRRVEALLQCRPAIGVAVPAGSLVAGRAPGGARRPRP